LVAILPGSRTQELKRNLPVMIRAALKLARQRPATRFAVACLHDRHKALAEQIIKEQARGEVGLLSTRIKVHSAHTPELIRLADMAWAVSGSVSLELMMEALPTVILYKLNRLDLMIARPFIKAKYITLVNLLANAELMPEYLTVKDVSDELVIWARTWLDDPIARARTTANLAALRHEVARPGASQRAAARIVGWLRQPHSSPPPYRGPHQGANHGDHVKGELESAEPTPVSR
jgi:lipid-A-disaccharide synthase